MSEYLIKQFHQTGEAVYLDMWEEALLGIQKHMITTTKHAHLRFVAELPSGIGGQLSPKMDHLVAFLPGSIALGATGGLTLAEARKLPTWNAQKEQQMELAKELTKTFWGMYNVTDTGLAPEIAWFEADEADLQPRPGERKMLRSSNKRDLWKKDYIIKPLDAHNLQRPETVESLLMMYRITEDPIYREWGWRIFESFQKYGLVDDGEGYTSLDDVRTVPPRRRDNMESFWLVRPFCLPLCDHSRCPKANLLFLSQTGRNTKVPIPVVLTTRFPTFRSDRLQHRSTHFPTNELLTAEVRDGLEAKVCSWEKLVNELKQSPRGCHQLSLTCRTQIELVWAASLHGLGKWKRHDTQKVLPGDTS